jgi:stage II sporulation protein M
MKRKPSDRITSLIYGNDRLLILVFFCFVTGVALGAFTVLLLSAEAKAGMQSFLDLHFMLPEPMGDLLPDLFLVSAATNLGLLLIIILAGLTVIGFPAALLVLIYKGAALGFAAALLMDTFDAKGVLLVLLTLFPPNLILIPALWGSAVASLRLTFDLLSEGPLQIKKNLSSKAGSFLVFQIMMAILILGGCFVESFISPLLQRLLG